MIRSNPDWAGSVQVIFRQQVQPWHPSSLWMHESAIAVQRLAPAKFWDYSTALFKVQKDFFDLNVIHEKRNEVYARLAKVAAGVGVDEQAVYKLLRVPDTEEERPKDGSLNVGNQITDDVKQVIKMARLLPVHVSPTVMFNGLVRDEFSSGWTGDQWKEWLGKNVV
jgi:hypothetical protein